ncbi:hypothetical protein THRCLA_20757 [Thraustotheca clavata]|uniref:RING-type domain-containing protein n=1 Tax=Thraustotheca clavata TaxID=74557 RepID=A0A1W0A3R2_9STRA|nr:hypothetical protein THRCLA_20757 [Thraustotheca clavata]
MLAEHLPAQCTTFPLDQTAYVSATCESAIEIRRSFAYTTYSIEVKCPITQRTWKVEKRCSAFYKFRELLAEFHARCQDNPMRLIAKSLLHISLPSKLVLDKYGSSTMRKRGKILKKYVWLALDCRSLCYIYPQDKRTVEHTELMELLDAFLQVPVNLRDIRFKEATQTQMDDSCAICTYEYLKEDFAELGKVVVLPCGHCFHRDCVSEWLFSHNTCPMCRQTTDRIAGLFAAQS